MLLSTSRENIDVVINQLFQMSLVDQDLDLPGKNDESDARMESHSIVGKYLSASLIMLSSLLTSIAATWLPRVAIQHIFSVVCCFIFWIFRNLVASA